MTITLVSCKFINNTNLMTSTHLYNNNRAGAFGVMLTLSHNTSVSLIDVTASGNSNVMTGSNLDEFNYGGAYHFHTHAGSNFVVRIHGGSISSNFNIQDSQGAMRMDTDTGNNLGSAICFFYSTPASSTFAAVQTLDSGAGSASSGSLPPPSANETGHLLVVSDVSFMYHGQYPLLPLVAILNTGLMNQDVCTSSSYAVNVLQLQSIFTDNNCGVICNSTQHAVDLVCIANPDAHGSALSVGECAFIGLGVGFGMLLVVVLGMLWARWFFKRFRRQQDAVHQGLTEKLLSTQKQGEGR